MLNYSYKTNKKKLIYRKLKTMVKFIIYMSTLIGLMILYVNVTGKGNISTVPFFIMAILAFTPFILPSWIKSKLNERKERKKEEERLKYQQYLDSLPKEPEVEIPKSVYFAEDDEEFVKEFGKPNLAERLLDKKRIKNVCYVGKNYGPLHFELFTNSSNYGHFGSYMKDTDDYVISSMSSSHNLRDVTYLKTDNCLYKVEYEEDTDTLLIKYLV